MKYKQNRKLEQITDSSLIVGADIAKKVHVARAQDFRGIEYGSRLTFENTHAGFNRLIGGFEHSRQNMRKRTSFLDWNQPAIIGCHWLSFLENKHPSGAGQSLTRKEKQGNSVTTIHQPRTTKGCQGHRSVG